MSELNHNNCSHCGTSCPPDMYYCSPHCGYAAQDPELAAGAQARRDATTGAESAIGTIRTGTEGHSLKELFPDLVHFSGGSAVFRPNPAHLAAAIQEAKSLVESYPAHNALGESGKAFWGQCVTTLGDQNPFADIHAKCLAYRAIVPPAR